MGRNPIFAERGEVRTVTLDRETNRNVESLAKKTKRKFTVMLDVLLRLGMRYYAEINSEGCRCEEDLTTKCQKCGAGYSTLRGTCPECGLENTKRRKKDDGISDGVHS